MKKDTKQIKHNKHAQSHEPISGKLGASILGPRNLQLEAQNPDILLPPRTDSGLMPNLKWSFANSHMRIEEGGWARETTIRDYPSPRI